MVLERVGWFSCRKNPFVSRVTKLLQFSKDNTHGYVRENSCLSRRVPPGGVETGSESSGRETSKPFVTLACGAERFDTPRKRWARVASTALFESTESVLLSDPQLQR